MILTHDELDSLVQARHSSPHTLLGMHPLGDGSGVVVRAFLPHAREVRIVPVLEKDRPTFDLQRIHDSGLFEGVGRGPARVYAYDLAVTDHHGNLAQGRDPFSFLPTLGESDLFLFNQGTENRIYEKLGAHHRVLDGVHGTSFAVWAPHARRVSVVGDFNDWDGRRHPMRLLAASGVWEIFVPNVGQGAHYKFELVDTQGAIRLKTDPYGFFFELAPKSAAIVWDLNRFEWSDADWMERRPRFQPFSAPCSIYEVHLGSWRKKGLGESFGYREIAQPLADYARQLGFTHVQFLPVAEHAYYPSWGYQVTGFYGATGRYGTPDDFQFLVDTLHKAGIGVIVDWVPAHFPRDDWALARFDGSALYEHDDPRQGAHQDWGTLIFNFARYEVRNFLAANALFWCDKFHIDGLRVDAVASMLYLDYSRRPGEWVPNKFGGRENLDAVDFLRHFNHLVHTENPGVLTIAEESTAWPFVTRPPHIGGLGFSFKWNMGWMHDTLNYFKVDPLFRKYRQNELTFAVLYHLSENYILPLSHDEVVHLKGSLRSRMPGDEFQGFANLRALLAYQWTFPGKKLLFMGGELGQQREWDANGELDWWLLEAGPYHAGIQRFVTDLNTLYRAEYALHEGDYSNDGFYWVDCTDIEHSVLSFVRQNWDRSSIVLVILNLTPVPRSGYRIGLPVDGPWIEILNTDAAAYGGSNHGNYGRVQAEAIPFHGQPFSAAFQLPPLSALALKPAPKALT